METTHYKVSQFNKFFEVNDNEFVALNTVSGAILKIDQLGRQYLDFEEPSKITPDVKKSLDELFIAGGYWIQDSRDEIASLREKHFLARNNLHHWSITICPTLDCNFNCDYCYERRKPGNMSIEVQNAFTKAFLNRVAELKAVHVTWYGGEPTLAWDVIERLSAVMIEACEHYNVMYSASIITNGYNFDSNKISSLEHHKIGFVQISLDGDRDFHDKRRALVNNQSTFDRILRNIVALNGLDVEVGIRINIDKRNIESIPSLLKRLSDAGIRDSSNITVNFAPIEPIATANKKVSEYTLSRLEFAELEPHLYHLANEFLIGKIIYAKPKLESNCVAIEKDGVVLTPDGSIHRCWEAMTIDEYKLGTILEGYPPSQDSRQYRFWMDWDPFAPMTRCLDCVWLPSCMGGCPLRSLVPDSLITSEPNINCAYIAYNSAQVLKLIIDQKNASIYEWIVAPNDISKKECEVCNRACSPKCDTKYVCRTQCGCLTGDKCLCLKPPSKSV